MQFLQELWFPIVVSSGAVFVLASLLWMATPLHKGEWRRLPTESDVLKALRGSPLPPGNYMLPFTEGQDLGRADLRAALEQGPVGHLAISKPGVPSMGGRIVLSILYYLAVSTVIAYVAWHGMTPQTEGTSKMPLGIEFDHVFRVVGTIALLAYGAGAAPLSIWLGRPWKSFVLSFIDAIVFALVTGAIFGRFWPV